MSLRTAPRQRAAYGRGMIDRKLARPLVVTFLVSVLTFLAGSSYTQHYLRKIDRSVDQIAHNASPTIEHATRLRITVRELRLALVTAVHDAERGEPPAPHFRELEQRVADDLELYFVTPFPNEAALWTDMRRHGESLAGAAEIVDVALRRIDLDAARTALARAKGAVDDLDLLLLQAIAINATTAHALADDIRTTRDAHARVNVVANVLGVLLSLTAMLLALRALRRYAATLHTAEANLQELVASSSDAMLLEHAGRIVETNEAARQLLGCSTKEDILGRPSSCFLGQDGNAHATAAPPPGAHRVRLCRPNGDRIDLDVCEMALEREGRPLRVVVLRDVTSRLALEARLVMADRLASVGTLAAGIAHEINNPLVYVLHNLTFAVEELGLLKKSGHRFEGVREALEDASRGAERVRDIVRDLGVLARGDHADDEDVDVHQVLDASANLATAKLRGLAVLVKDYGALPMLRGSASRLGQVLLNLIINAIHAMEGREGSDAPQICLRTRTSSTGEAIIDGRGQRKGDRAGNSRPPLRSLLHHEAHRARQRARIVDYPHHRHRVGRADRSGERRRRRNDLPGPTPRRPSAAPRGRRNDRPAASCSPSRSHDHEIVRVPRRGARDGHLLPRVDRRELRGRERDRVLVPVHQRGGVDDSCRGGRREIRREDRDRVRVRADGVGGHRRRDGDVHGSRGRRHRGRGRRRSTSAASGGRGRRGRSGRAPAIRVRESRGTGDRNEQQRDGRFVEEVSAREHF